MSVVVCASCGEEKPATEEYFYKAGPKKYENRLDPRCIPCRRKYSLERYHKIRKGEWVVPEVHAGPVKVQRMREIKTTRGCADCGYRDHPEALDFDHLPGFQKSFPLSAWNVRARNWAEVEEEMAKCEVVCANCHRVRSARRRASRKAP